MFQPSFAFGGFGGGGSPYFNGGGGGYTGGNGSTGWDIAGGGGGSFSINQNHTANHGWYGPGQCIIKFD